MPLGVDAGGGQGEIDDRGGGMLRTQTLGEIAQDLNVSRNTIKSHTKAIYRKLGVADRGDAIRCGKELGILL